MTCNNAPTEFCVRYRGTITWHKKMPTFDELLNATGLDEYSQCGMNDRAQWSQVLKNATNSPYPCGDRRYLMGAVVSVTAWCDL